MPVCGIWLWCRSGLCGSLYELLAVAQAVQMHRESC